MRTPSFLLLALALFGLGFAVPAQASGSSRIKDIVDVEGVRENQLIGYGLVVGLQGTGDSLNNSPFTKQSLQAMLERLGVNVRDSTMRTANTAAWPGPSCSSPPSCWPSRALPSARA